MRMPKIVEAIENPLLLGAAFPRGLESWAGLITLLKALFGLPLDDAEVALYFVSVRAGKSRHRPNLKSYGG